MPYWDDGSGVVWTLPISPKQSRSLLAESSADLTGTTNDPVKGTKDSSRLLPDGHARLREDRTQPVREPSIQVARSSPRLGMLNTRAFHSAGDSKGARSLSDQVAVEQKLNHSSQSGAATDRAICGQFLVRPPTSTLAMVVPATHTRFVADSSTSPCVESSQSDLRARRRISDIVEEPSPLRILKLGQARAAGVKSESSPTLEKIQSMRKTEAQLLGLAKLERELAEVALEVALNPGYCSVDHSTTQSLPFEPEISTSQLPNLASMHIAKEKETRSAVEFSTTSGSLTDETCNKEEATIPCMGLQPSVSATSLFSAATSEFECVTMPRGSEAERNGGTRKWYQFCGKKLYKDIRLVSTSRTDV
ncbi:hypothetical protein ACN47E_004857 [Coniothyrium glycines]